MVYWSERVKDNDAFIAEENERLKAAQDGVELGEPSCGWIYKTAENMSEELMMGLSPRTMSRHFNQLVAKGFLQRRRNPFMKLDKTFQYRVNIISIMKAMSAKGYALEGYSNVFFELEQDCQSERHDDSAAGRNVTLKEDGGLVEETCLTQLEEEDTLKDETAAATPQTCEKSDYIPKDKMSDAKDKMSQQYQRLHTEITNRDYNTEITDRDILSASHSATHSCSSDDERASAIRRAEALGVESKPESDTAERSVLSAKQKKLFDMFWEIYPRKVQKTQAMKAWEKIRPRPNEDTIQVILDGVNRCIKYDYRFRERQFTPHPATWLNAHGWESEYDGCEESDSGRDRRTEYKFVDSEDGMQTTEEFLREAGML